MHRTVTLDQVQQVLRARVCRNCKVRHPGRPGDPLQTDRPLDCEAGCELFHNLPELSTLANHLDPMLRSYDVALGRRVSQLIESFVGAGRTGRDGRTSPLNRHRRCVIDTLSELIDGRPARTRTRRIP
jgi:hypothetical protein